PEIDAFWWRNRHTDEDREPNGKYGSDKQAQLQKRSCGVRHSRMRIREATWLTGIQPETEREPIKAPFPRAFMRL
ncbi:MAG TPA: hypothetical protein VFQ66_00680, partial [Candidatus Limnocylindria bacterium]|nr:hypothetical protein [Candidatus Limnocylindria bacterium]